MSCLKFPNQGCLDAEEWQLRCVFPLLLFQNGSVANEEYQNQQDFNINFYKMADMINEEISAWEIMFWRGVSNPQSGEKYDYSNETYTL